MRPPCFLFVKLLYSEPSSYLWQNDAGDVHNILQEEGGEQGDGLMPMMYALGQHDGLDEARSLLPPSDALIAYLDDIYLLTQEQHARAFRYRHALFVVSTSI